MTNEVDPWGILLVGVISAIALTIGWKKDFFSFSDDTKISNSPIKLFHVLSPFFIYFATALFITPQIGHLLRQAFPGISPLEILKFASWLNFINSLIIFVLLGLFIFACSPQIREAIWRRGSERNQSYGDDFRTAIFAWFISFPLVIFLGQLFDWLTSLIFNVKEMPEQLAVHFLKMTFGVPFYFALTVSTIILFAPMIEETLFRGFLQSFIRQHLGSKQAIFITSLLFAFFHYSDEQGLGNIPIIASLFVLALFLGFVYEKRRSLFAPIVLHASFNLISVLNLYFLGDFPKGPL